MNKPPVKNRVKSRLITNDLAGLIMIAILAMLLFDSIVIYLQTFDNKPVTQVQVRYVDRVHETTNTVTQTVYVTNTATEPVVITSAPTVTQKPELAKREAKKMKHNQKILFNFGVPPSDPYEHFKDETINQY